MVNGQLFLIFSRVQIHVKRIQLQFLDVRSLPIDTNGLTMIYKILHWTLPQHIELQLYVIYVYCSILSCHFSSMSIWSGASRGGSRGRTPPPPPPLKLEKLWFFGVKSWFFTRITPKMFAPPSARRNFFKCAPPPPNLKSSIHPWLGWTINTGYWGNVYVKDCLCCILLELLVCFVWLVKLPLLHCRYRP